MKIRTDFVTNSSSSSFIICFARVDDIEKAKPIIEKHNLELLDVEGVNDEKDWTGTLGAEWCGAEIFGADKVMEEHPNDKYVVLKESLEADYNEDGEPMYRYDFEINKILPDIISKNGFADIKTAEGEGRDG